MAWADPNATRMTQVLCALALVLIGLPADAQQPTSKDHNHLMSGWKYYSDNSIANPPLTVRDFFLQESVKRKLGPTGRVSTLTVWTKGLSAASVAKTGQLPKAGLDRAATKWLTGYDPPSSAVRKLSDDDRLAVIYWEEVADEQLVQPELKALVEIDCVNQVARTLSIVITHHGKTGLSDRPTAWGHVPPKSSAANLSSILCK